MARFMAIKAQGDGQLPSSEGTLYTVPTATQAIIRTITLVNTTTNTIKVNLYLNLDGTNSRRILPFDMELAGRFMAVLDDVLTLEAGDLIQGDADVAATVDYVLSGTEEQSA